MNLDAASAGLEGDDGLFARIAAGDQRALGVLCDRHGATSYALACAVTAVPSVAEAVVADSFAQLWREAPTFDPKRMSVFAWLMSIVRTRALAARPRDVAIPRVLSKEMRADGRTDGGAVHSNALLQAVVTLDGPQALALELAFFRGMTKRQIASELQLTESMVAHLLRRAVETLRASVPRNNVRPSPTAGAGGVFLDSPR
ncbi:MAG: sigma factor-like helix-turn-helix DNA-binding protein [Gemmatimonadota bacterium]